MAEQDGRRVRSGIPFCSDAMQVRTEQDVRRLVQDLGIGLVVDLRGELEAVEGRGSLA